MQIVKEDLSPFISELVTEASNAVTSGKVQIAINEDLQSVDMQTVVEDNGYYSLHIRPEILKDEYKISHELLHFCVRNLVPTFVRVIEPNLIGMIGSELQGYLEHNWILAEQKRRGLDVEKLQLFSDIENTLEPDHDSLEKNISTILILNNIIHSYPFVYDKHLKFFQRNNPKSLEFSKRIMSHYPKQELYSSYEARKATVKAIKEWNKIFSENGLSTVNLSMFLSVIPVFSQAQLNRVASLNLGLIPNAIIDHKRETRSHVIYTLNDGQSCIVFSMDENGLEALKGHLNRQTLIQFLNLTQIDYLLR